MFLFQERLDPGLKMSNGLARPGMARARARHGPIGHRPEWHGGSRACTVLRAQWSAQARHVGRFTGRASPKST